MLSKNLLMENLMQSTFQFGETVPGYTIPVVNEREVRATAGIMFLATFISLMMIINGQNFVPIKYVVIIFLVDFAIRLFISPKFAPLLILGRMMVTNQNPEYVGAPQKKFAWGIGLALSSMMFVFMVVLNTFSIITGLTCLLCLILTFFETAFGICIGCKVYGMFNKGKAQYCPGEVCDVKNKQDIQKVSMNQLFIVLGLLTIMAILGFAFHDMLKPMPTDLFAK